VINTQLDQHRGGMPVLAKERHGTIPWVIEVFKQSPKWAKLRASTQCTYETQFNAILRWSASRGDPPMYSITRLDAEQFWRALHQRAPKRAQDVIARCSQLWNYALDLDQDLVTRNPFRGMGLPDIPSRSQVWTPEQIVAFCQTAIELDRTASRRPGPPPSCAAMALAVTIAVHTAQRPSDIRALRWSQYDGQFIRLKQIKTGAHVTIPVTPALKAALDDAKRQLTEGKVVALGAADTPIVCASRGKPFSADAFLRTFRMIMHAARLPDTLQYRDLRRTATVALAEAGCSLHEIASIGGWSLQTVAAMMAVYGKTNEQMALSAIAKLEAWRAQQAKS